MACSSSWSRTEDSQSSNTSSNLVRATKGSKVRKIQVDFKSDLEKMGCDCCVRDAAKVSSYDKKWIDLFFEFLCDAITHARECNYRINKLKFTYTKDNGIAES